MVEHVTPRIAEGIRRLSPRIMTPDAFDRRIREDDAFRSQIGGFNSQSLEVILNGMSGSAFRFPLYGSLHPQINLELTEQCHTQTFGSSENHPQTLEAVVRNREYGASNTLHALIVRFASANYTPRRIEEILTYEGGIDVMMEYFTTEQGVAQLQVNMEKGVEALYTPLEEGGILPLDDDLDTNLQRATRIARDLGLTMDKIRQIEMATHERGGVQVIFGPADKLAAFLLKAHAKGVDDISASITTPIPDDLIVAIIPLGKYEKRILLGSAS